MNVAIVKSATIVARALGIISASQDIIQPMGTIYDDVYQQADWHKLIGDGSIRKLYLNRQAVDEAFVGTEAEHVDEAPLRKNRICLPRFILRKLIFLPLAEIFSVIANITI